MKSYTTTFPVFDIFFSQKEQRMSHLFQFFLENDERETEKKKWKKEKWFDL